MSKANYSTITVDPEGASEPREEVCKIKRKGPRLTY
jgi:hypothetical protein